MNEVLYCLMREDIPDLNPGKGMAQAMHAQANFQAQWRGKPEYIEWCKQSYYAFGTTIVLSAVKKDIEDLRRIVSATRSDGRTPSFGVVVDPTYPWRNFSGKLFLTETMTCAWWFKTESASQEELDFIASLELYR